MTVTVTDVVMVAMVRMAEVMLMMVTAVRRWLSGRDGANGTSTVMMPTKLVNIVPKMMMLMILMTTMIMTMTPLMLVLAVVMMMMMG